MSNRLFCLFLLAGLGACSPLPKEPAESSSGEDSPSFEPPNLIFLMMDDAHYDDFGCGGNDEIMTPNLDQLKREGICFTQAYSSGPVCSPTRAALLTGQYPHRFNLHQVLRLSGYPDESRNPVVPAQVSHRGIPDKVISLADLPLACGYRTFHLGKWHVGRRIEEFGPQRHGFEHSVVCSGGRNSAYQENNLFFDESVVMSSRTGPGARIEKGDGHLTDVLTRRAVGFIRDHASERFFLNVWFVAPHEPLQPSARWAARYPDDEMGRYAALISSVDEGIGRVVDTLDDLGIREQTLLIVTSDNGGSRKSNRDSPLRGAKGSLFEGGIRVPMVASWPGTIEAGSVSDHFIKSIDLLPTVADLLSEETPPRVDGVSFLPVLFGRDPDASERIVFWEAARRTNVSRVYAVRRGRWKLVSSAEGSALFDLDTDPFERKDVRDENPETSAELEAAYRRWRLTDRRMHYLLEPAKGVTGTLGQEVTSGALSFGSAGTEVRIAESPLFDFHDGEFSLSFHLRLDGSLPRDGKSIALARNDGSWSLHLLPTGRLRLHVHGDGGGDALLESSDSVTPGRKHHIAWVARGHSYENAKIALFLDGELQVESAELRAVSLGSSSVVFGTTRGTVPFVGELEGVTMYLMALEAEEVVTLARVSDP